MKKRVPQISESSPPVSLLTSLVTDLKPSLPGADLLGTLSFLANSELLRPSVGLGLSASRPGQEHSEEGRQGLPAGLQTPTPFRSAPPPARAPICPARRVYRSGAVPPAGGRGSGELGGGL